MLRPELIHRLREATPAAPAGLRARVRALEPAPAHRRFTARRLAVAMSAAAVVGAAVVALLVVPSSSAPSNRGELGYGVGAHGSGGITGYPVTSVNGAATASSSANGAPYSSALSAVAPERSIHLSLPTPSTIRAQRYAATLHLRLHSGPAVAAASRRAVAIVESLGGFEQRVRISVTAKAGSAVLVLRVPRAAVTAAIARLSGLGVVIGEQLSVTDLQRGIDALGLHIEQLEKALAAASHAPATVQNERLVASLTAEIVALQRSRAATARSAADATISLDLSTPPHAHPQPHSHGHGPFHALGVAFRDVGIGLIYLLALGTPLAVVVALGVLGFLRLRRRREERLLSRS